MQKDKMAISAIIIIFFFLPPVAYTKGSSYEHFLYMFSHASWIHLALNLFILWRISIEKVILSSYIICVAASFVCYAPLPTLGLSGFICAAYGGRCQLLWNRILPAYKCLIILSLHIGFFNPAINNWLHILCFTGGFLWGMIDEKYR